MASKGDFLPTAWIQQMTPIFFDSMKPRDWDNVQAVCHSLLRQGPFCSLSEKLSTWGAFIRLLLASTRITALGSMLLYLCRIGFLDCILACYVVDASITILDELNSKLWGGSK